MPLPFLIAGAAIVAAGTGIKKGMDASDKNKKAERIVADAEERLEFAEEEFPFFQEELNKKLESYGAFKVDIFTTYFDNLLKMSSYCVQDEADATFLNKKIFSKEELKELEKVVLKAEEISGSLVEGAGKGALGAMGAYGSVGMLATASTGTAIGSLSGAAATNATLAWLGGGALSAGGFGMAGGMAVLGGLVAGPAIAIAGFAMDSSAEKNLTKAEDFEANVDIRIEELDALKETYKTMMNRVDELELVIAQMKNAYDKILNQILQNGNFFDKIKMSVGVKPSNLACKHPKFADLLVTAHGLKELLDVALVDAEGLANYNFDEEVETIKIAYLAK